MALYPIFVETAGRRVIVIGGGHVGAEKVRGLLAAEAAHGRQPGADPRAHRST